MTTHCFRIGGRWLLLPVLTLAFATSAYADGGHRSAMKSAAAPSAMPGMSAEEHAGMAGDGHGAMPGMSAEEHAGMAGEGHEAMPGMSAEEHAGMAGDGHGAMPGMSAEEHARMAGDGHGAMPGMSAHEHAQRAGHDERATGKRPVALALGGFGLFNGIVLLYAAVLRRRPAVRKRLETLARVRASAGKRTVLPAPAPGEARS